MSFCFYLQEWPHGDHTEGTVMNAKHMMRLMVFNEVGQLELGSQAHGSHCRLMMSQRLTTIEADHFTHLPVQEQRVLSQKQVHAHNGAAHAQQHLQGINKKIATDTSHDHLHYDGPTNGNIEHNASHGHSTKHFVHFAHCSYIENGNTNEGKIVIQSGIAKRGKDSVNQLESIDNVNIVHGHAERVQQGPMNERIVAHEDQQNVALNGSLSEQRCEHVRKIFQQSTLSGVLQNKKERCNRQIQCHERANKIGDNFLDQTIDFFHLSTRETDESCGQKRMKIKLEFI